MAKREFDTSLPEIESDSRDSFSDAVLVSDTSARREEMDDIRPASPRPNPAPTPAPRPIPTVRHLPARRPAPAPAAPERQYEYSPLIRRVTVLPWPQNYNYYQRFVLDAEKYARIRGKEAPHVPFFSYIPQYAQLGREQLLFYFWFREQCRARIPMEGVDFAYILLYIYEIINLTSVPPGEGADTLAWLWLSYRRRFAELDKYLSEWMCDYCLVHQIPMPDCLSEILPEIVRRASLKEFYLAPAGDCTGEIPPLSADALLALASDYSYRASKYYKDHEKEYDTHIPAALLYAAQVCGFLPTAQKMRTARAERDAFCGSLCAQTVKRRIVLEFRSFARSQELRQQVTQAVKLAENQLRARTKIKARLSTEGYAPDVAAAVAEYFGEKLPLQRKRRETLPERQYEHLYDAPTEGIDRSLSHKIEAESWENTALLSPDFAAQATEPLFIPFPPPKAEPQPGEQSVPAAPVPEEGGLTDLQRALLEHLLDGGSLVEWCREQSVRKDPAMMAAALNDFAMDELGDVILEEDGGVWHLIEDYREDIRSWITP